MMYQGNARNGIVHRPDPAWLSILVLVYVLVAAIAAGN